MSRKNIKHITDVKRKQAIKPSVECRSSILFQGPARRREGKESFPSKRKKQHVLQHRLQQADHVTCPHSRSTPESSATLSSISKCLKPTIWQALLGERSGSRGGREGLPLSFDLEGSAKLTDPDREPKHQGVPLTCLLYPVAAG